MMLKHKSCIYTYLALVLLDFCAMGVLGGQKQGAKGRAVQLDI
jgi:hypothetical protein